MSAYQVSIVADEASSLAGAAVLRIDGLKRWPPGATIRILPIDDAMVPANSDGWPWGELSPLRVLPTANGVDVILGPEVANAARLNPGTPVTILIPAADIEVEARWPSMTPTMRRRPTAVAMSAAQILAARTKNEQAALTVGERRQELAEFATSAKRDAPATVETPTPSALPTTELTTTTSPNRAEPATSASDRAQSVERNAAERELSRLSTRRKPAVDDAPPPSPAPGPRAADQVVPKVAAITPTAARRKPHRSSRFSAFLAGITLTTATVALALNFGPTSWRPPALSHASSANVEGHQLDLADAAELFKDLASTGMTSPANKPTAGVDIGTALSLADHALRGERTNAETAEAAFWLKRALAASFGGADVGWALTQLGTIYATPGVPDHSYVKAHTIWQMAAAQGDPVAHCFLGALYEYGLGVRQNRTVALEHYKLARAQGVCRGADDAVTRLSN